jgi:aminoglycoside 3-N-acetyltransferase
VTAIRPHSITDAIRALGASAGDLLLAHSSYRSFGAAVIGGPAAVAGAIIDAVSPGGSIFIPTFNYGQAPFDAATTPSFDGAVSEAFRQLPGVRRSLHATHPLAGFGPAAEEILAGHDLIAHQTVFGPGSPVWRLWERNAWVLLIGCGHESNSTIHIAEEIVRVPYLERTRTGSMLRDAKVVEVTVRRPSCSEGFGKLDPRLRAAGAIRDRYVQQSHLKLMRSRDVVEAAVAALREDPASLLCDRCEFCAESRRMIQAATARSDRTAGNSDV